MRRLGLWLKQQSRRRAPTPDGFAFVPLRVPCSWRHPLGFRTGNGVAVRLRLILPLKEG
jgi:hypothetical protein